MRNAYSQLKDAAGPGGYSEDRNEIAPLLEEWRGRVHGNSPLLLKPSTTEQIQTLLAICHRTGTPLVPQGGNTGLVAGQIPLHGEVLLSLKRMNRVRRLDAEGMVLVAEAGVTLKAAQDAAQGAGLLFPLTLASEGSCTIGGNVSTNAGGNHVLRYGMTRSLVLGLEVVLADGRLLSMLRPLLKDNSGYDLKQLFLGAEGTLGVVTAAALRLYPRPAQIVTAFAAVPAPASALKLMRCLQGETGGLVSCFELISRAALELVLAHIPGTREPLALPSPWYVLMEVSGGKGIALDHLTQGALETALSAGWASDAALAQSEAQTRDFWRLREAISEAEKREGVSVKHDISVPVASIPAFIEEATASVVGEYPGARPICFGHMGDGNLHFNFAAPKGRDEAFALLWDEIQLIVHDVVHRYGGSISAEHGIGAMKRDILPRYKASEELAVMRAIKHALDPDNILNPGKTVPPVKRL
ncbi:MAG: FAD-binding oxidoreductase [Rhizomicrobium sp.]